MGHELSNIRHNTKTPYVRIGAKDSLKEDFVLEKGIFTNIFEKDIRRVFIYKKAERLAKALHLIAPAFANSASLKSRIDAIAIGLVDAAVLPSVMVRTELPRELLALSSVLSIARTSGILSPMNSDIIIRESRILLQEIVAYEEPRIFLEESISLPDIAKNAQKSESVQGKQLQSISEKHSTEASKSEHKGHIKDIKVVSSTHIKDRRESILSVIKNKEKSSIKDIVSIVRGVSEKTIQRELIALIAEGVVSRHGERRWSTYSLV